MTLLALLAPLVALGTMVLLQVIEVRLVRDAHEPKQKPRPGLQASVGPSPGASMIRGNSVEIHPLGRTRGFLPGGDDM